MKLKLLIAMVIVAGVTVLAGNAWYQNKLAHLSTDKQSLALLGREPFSPQKWAEAAPIAKSQMLYNFVSRFEISKMTKQDLEQILGKPDTYLSDEQTLGYRVGPDSIRTVHGPGYIFALSKLPKTSSYSWDIEPVPCQAEGFMACLLQ